MSTPSTLSRFQGSLLGLAIGDALGGKFEGQTATYIRSRIPSLTDLIHYPADSLWYTDDTQMMIGIAETLLKHREIVESSLCESFVENYMPSRGYGRGARAVLEAMEEGRDYYRVANTIFPGGSYGNGAAMRVAPIGLLFRDDLETLVVQARKSALPTHTNELGIEGAVILAAAVGIASKMEIFDQEEFLQAIRPYCKSDIYIGKLNRVAAIQSERDILLIGNGIAAQESVITAIACFVHSPHSYKETIATAIFLGGDTDTIAAMAGAISGSFLGMEALPEVLLSKLEQSPKGKDYILHLANELYSIYAI